MKQITVISGKGGTGKTSITSALATIAKNSVIADCDVDAADMFLIMKPHNIKTEKFPGGKVAVIDDKKCTNCGICKDLCNFDAISLVHNKMTVSDFACEGCELCMHACPEHAISMQQSDDSRWFIANTRFGPMIHARLGIAEDLSGKLVAIVREQAKKIAEKQNKDYILIDGPPGIGCSVIASLTGTDIAVIVTEPTQSGLHDLKRIAKLTQHFKVKSYAIINKFDINNNVSHIIENYCNDNNIDMIAKIPFDKTFVDAMISQQSIIEYNPDSEISKIIYSIWEKIKL